MRCPVIDTLLFEGLIFKYSDLEPWCTLEGTEIRPGRGRGSALNLEPDFIFCRSGSQYSQTSLGL